jgi:hypothetical protein
MVAAFYGRTEMIDLKRDELEKMALEIGNTRFQIKNAPFPFCLLWFQIDRVDLGRLMLKVAEAPKILPDGNILTQEKLQTIERPK